VGVATTSSKRDYGSVTVEEHYKVGVKSTQEFGWRLQKQVDEQYKVGVKSTNTTPLLSKYSVEERYKMGVTSTMVDYKEITNQAEERYKEITTTNNQLQFYLEKDVEELYLTNKQEIQ
jgi:hypothetical protein